MSAAAADTRPPIQPNVLVIVMDATRPDHLGCYGYARETSPVVDELARGGILLENAFSSCGWTKPSIASLFTGVDPIQHRVLRGNTRDRADRITSDVLRADVTTLAEAFRARGYATAAFIENVQIASFMGFNQGFDVYAENLGEASRITAAFRDWLPKCEGRPFLAYLHYLDAHWPYTPPRPYDTIFPAPAGGTLDFNAVNWKYLERQIASKEVVLSPQDLERMRALYDGEIRSVDAAIGAVLDALRALGLSENTLIVVTADHGEEFLEHGRVGHGNSIYEEVLHVPLVMKIPSVAPARVGAAVRLIDVMPTLLDYAGLPAVAGIGGRSLRPLVQGDDPAVRIAFADYRQEDENGYVQQSVRLGTHKLIRTLVEQREDVAGAEPAAAAALPEIRPGQWLKIKSVRQASGSLLALELKPLTDEDQVKITGRIEEVGPTPGGLRVQGFACRLLPAAKFKDTADRTVKPYTLEAGMWVQVRGTTIADGVFEVSRIRRIDAADRPEEEIKAPVENVRDGTEGPVLGLLGVEVLTDDDTEFDGDWPASQGAPAPAVPSPAPAPVLSRTVVTVELYDLAVDPGETRNIADSQPQRVLELIDRLDEWERTYGADARASQQVPLDPASIEKLRSLGYTK